MTKTDRPPAEELARAIMRAATLVRAELRRGLRSSDVTPEEWLILDLLWRSEAPTQQDLARLTGKDKSTVTRLVDALVVKKLVARHDDPADPRRTKACLTQRGLELQRTAGPAVAAILRVSTATLDERALRSATAVLNRLAGHITSD